MNNNRTKQTPEKNEPEPEPEPEPESKPKAVVVGGSIAGVCCAHALLAAGWDVVVLEKALASSTASATGAGLGLDPLSCNIIESWLGRPDLLYDVSVPLSIDQNEATDAEKKTKKILTRDEHFNFRAVHWADLHALLHGALPPKIFLWGHQFMSFSINHDENASVSVKAKILRDGKMIDIVGDLLVAADGCLSSIRRTFLPEHKLRYAGYCAWRGVLDFSGNENSDPIEGIRKAYPDLGRYLYFDLSLDSRSHCVLYELHNKRMNWLWYVNQPEPEVKGGSVTMKVNNEMIEKMHKEAEKVWVPELVKLIKSTNDPFINVIYDSDPLEKITFQDKVVLVGDSAHPTTPHCLRSTNTSVLDAAVLGKCLEKWGRKDLGLALSEYESVRVPVVPKQVVHARWLGQVKQGLVGLGCPEDWSAVEQRNLPFFGHVPDILLPI